MLATTATSSTLRGSEVSINRRLRSSTDRLDQHLVEKDFNEVTFPGTNDPQAYASTYERRVEGSGDEAEHPVKGILKSPSSEHDARFWPGLTDFSQLLILTKLLGPGEELLNPSQKASM